MHLEAEQWVIAHCGKRRWGRVLEFGSKDQNGSPRIHITADHYYGIDMQEGPGVDEVADAASYWGDEPYDLVVCTEVLEHTPLWPAIVLQAWANLRIGGTAVFTMACDPRGPHSAIIIGDPLEGEYYGNVPVELFGDLIGRLFAHAMTDVLWETGDLRAVAIR